MPSNTFYNEILTDHNLHPGHKHDLPDAEPCTGRRKSKLWRRYLDET